MRRRHDDTPRLPNWLLGLILLVVISVGSFVAYTKDLPWSEGFKVNAVFTSPQNMRLGSPVRIAGVEVGEVTDIAVVGDPGPDPTAGVRAGPPEAGGTEGSGIRVTMELQDEALPLREDSFFKIRPRLFLDGNYFVDLSPGSPSSPEVSDGHTFGLERTAHSVQLDQVLGVFENDVREDFRTLLDQFGNTLTRYGGAEGLRELYRTSPAAYRYSAEVAESQLGTEPHDLSGMIRGLGKVLGGLSRNELALANLVTNLRTVTGSFAAQDRSLARVVELLAPFLEEGPPTFQRLNSAFPSLRAFAREALPGVEKSPEALRAQIPMLQQLRALVSRDELRGLVAQLRPTVPKLAALARGNIELFREQRAFSSCFNEVIIPWSNSTVDPVETTIGYPLPVGGRTFEEAAFALTGSSSESRTGDAMGQHLRVMGGGGYNLVRYDATPFRDEVFGLVPADILGAIPRVNDSRKTKFRPNVPCERQVPPNLQAGISPPPDQEPVPTSAAADLDLAEGTGAERLRELLAVLNGGGLDGPDAKRQIAEAQEMVDELGFPEVNVAAALEGAG